MASHAKETAPGELVPVKFSRLTRRGVLLDQAHDQLSGAVIQPGKIV